MLAHTSKVAALKRASILGRRNTQNACSGLGRTKRKTAISAAEMLSGLWRYLTVQQDVQMMKVWSVAQHISEDSFSNLSPRQKASAQVAIDETWQAVCSLNVFGRTESMTDKTRYTTLS